MLVEIFWQTIASVLVFIVWYYPTGLWKNIDPTLSGGERAGIMFLFIWLFLLFTSTLSQALAIAMDDAQTVINIAQALWSLAVIFCGILVAPGNLPVFWKFMYRLSPATYLINGMVIAGIANTNITCSSTELLKISLPEGLLGNCSTYMRPFLKTVGGYVVDEAAVDGCTYCPLRNANEYLMIRELDVDDRWKYVGLFSVYIVFNIIATFGLYKLARTSKSAKK
jgi:ABC-type multidrug transport system permease subunit